MYTSRHAFDMRFICYIIIYRSGNSVTAPIFLSDLIRRHRHTLLHSYKNLIYLTNIIMRTCG